MPWQHNFGVFGPSPKTSFDGLVFKKFNLVFQHCGAISSNTKHRDMDLFKTHHPSVVYVYETHVHFAKVKHFWNSLNYSSVAIQEARGHANGIWVLSFVDNATLGVLDIMSQAVTLLIQRNNEIWCCASIYASTIFEAHIVKI